MSLILETVQEHARQRPDEVALMDGAVSLSYGSLSAEIVTLAKVLEVKCRRPGAIAYCLDNSAAWVVLDLAFVELRRPVVPLPPFFTSAQRRHVLEQAGVSYLIVDRPLADENPSGSMTVCGRDIHWYEYDAWPVDLPPGTAKITYTSGTTGQPKGVCLSQEGLEQVAISLVDIIGTEYAGIHCAVLPLAILLENIAGLYPTLLAGGCYHAPSLMKLGFANTFSPDFGTLVRALKSCDATSIIVVPEILRGLLAALVATSTSLPAMKLIAVGGAKVPRALLETAEAMGLPVFQGYGLSEAASVVAFNTHYRNRLGSVGRPLPHTCIELAADGEILIFQPALLGYVGEAAMPRVLATGDIGRFDEDGFLHIEGRKSNILITAFGRNVAPEWVESELLSQPQIGQAIVFGEGRPALGALIVPSSLNVTDADIARAVEQANRNLPDYARIVHWAKVRPFTPINGQLTDNGRLKRPAILDAYHSTIARCLERKGQYVSFFETLIIETTPEREYLQASPQIRDGLQGKISRQAYLDYLAEAFHHVKHTVPLMTLAAQKIPPEKAWLRELLGHYIEEETSHEEWILDDIRHVGGNPDAVRHGVPRLETELMVAYAYDFVGRVNPVGFFGMVLVLEGTSMQLASRGAHALMQSLGLSESCFHYLLSHGALDIDHIKFLENLMNRIDDPSDQAAIIHMAKAMFILFANVFRSIPHNAEEADAT
ncbi:MAG: AMP-binding protein [Parvibaculum sedimenti]|uniref:AMP-binding protein n=1 Tax=Parvibaculum sedimenti TaxID=2608632 RepID=UPI003BB5D805